jgi:hypothetical protein
MLSATILKVSVAMCGVAACTLPPMFRTIIDAYVEVRVNKQLEAKRLSALEYVRPSKVCGYGPALGHIIFSLEANYKGIVMKALHMMDARLLHCLRVMINPLVLYIEDKIAVAENRCDTSIAKAKIMETFNSMMEVGVQPSKISRHEGRVAVWVTKLNEVYPNYGLKRSAAEDGVLVVELKKLFKLEKVRTIDQPRLMAEVIAAYWWLQEHPYFTDFECAAVEMGPGYVPYLGGAAGGTKHITIP